MTFDTLYADFICKTWLPWRSFSLREALRAVFNFVKKLASRSASAACPPTATQTSNNRTTRGSILISIWTNSVANRADNEVILSAKCEVEQFPNPEWNNSSVEHVVLV